MKSMLVIRGIVNLTLDPDKIPLPYANGKAVAEAINGHLSEIGSIEIAQMSTITRARLAEDVLKTWEFDEPLDEGGVKVKPRRIRVTGDDGNFQLSVKDGDKLIEVGTFAKREVALAIGTAWQLGDIKL